MSQGYKMGKLWKLKRAVKEANDISDIQMGFVFGIGYMMMLSLIFHSLLPTRWHYMAAGVVLLIAAYIERVCLWYSKI